MNHHDATAGGMVERYLLDELPPDQREAFEEHYFACDECARAVVRGARFTANARAVFAEMPAEDARKPSWIEWFRMPGLAWAAAFGIAVIAAYQSAVVVPGLRERVAQSEAPQEMVAVVLAPGTRGDDTVVRLRPGQRFAQATLETASGQVAAGSAWEMLDASGRQVASAVVTDPRPALTLLISRTLPAGRYTVTLRDAPQGRVLEQFRFQLQTD